MRAVGRRQFGSSSFTSSVVVALTAVVLAVLGCGPSASPQPESPPSDQSSGGTDSIDRADQTAETEGPQVAAPVLNPPAEPTPPAADSAAGEAASADSRAAEGPADGGSAGDASSQAAGAAASEAAVEPGEPADAGTSEAAPDEASVPAAVVASGASAERGKQLYAQHCAACHGVDGNGQGIAAAYVFPKPRNIRAGKFRLVSTDNNVPSREDLHAVLTRGIPGSSMPPWAHLPSEDREALVDEVMRLRREGAEDQYVALLKEQDGLTDEELAGEETQAEIAQYVEQVSTPGASTEVPEMAAADAESIARGRKIYETSGCLQCHGSGGKGDGVQAMFDDEKYPTAPRDFTAGIFKGGHDPASIYRRIAYGLPGTPMPASQQLTPEQMVDLVHYTLSLSTEEQRLAAILNREKLVARSVSQLPSDVTGGGWEDVEAVSLRMAPLWWRNGADPDLRVQAVHDGQTLAVRISWQDDDENGHAAQSQTFEDAVAMELYQGQAEPFLGMGAMDASIDIWFWDADRQGEPMVVEKLYENSVVDVYPFSEKAATSPELDRDGARTADQPDISLTARASGNQIVPAGGPSGATYLTAGGPGSSTFRPPTSQLVTARGVWQDGRWHVVMTRPLAVASPDEGLTLAVGSRVSAAFAVWDGGHQDRDGKKQVTIWQDLELQQ